ncbi:MAG TPA: hypothetical protein VJX67_18195 [Blastocatellia bacterium]|nr:hypothetical protein [Blastocatellia bacterium]
MKKKRADSDQPTVESLITVAEAAELRGVTKNAIWDLINRDKLRTIRQFNRVLLYRDEVATYQPARSGRPRKDSTNSRPKPTRGRKQE